MKRIFFCIIILLAGISSVSAQSGMPADTVRTAVRGEASPEGMSPSEKELLPDVKNYDGFLLDMGLIPKTRVRVEKVAPLGDPLELRVRGYSLSLRKEDAGKIEVEVAGT